MPFYVVDSDAHVVEGSSFMQEMGERERTDLSDEVKAKIFGRNAQRFYGLV